MKAINHASELLETKNINSIYCEEDKTSKYYITKLRRDRKKNSKKNIKYEYIVPTNSDIVESENPKKKNVKKSKKNKGKSDSSEIEFANIVEGIETVINKKIQIGEKPIEENNKSNKTSENNQKTNKNKNTNTTVDMEKGKKEVIKNHPNPSKKDDSHKLKDNPKKKEEDSIQKKDEIIDKKEDSKNKKKEQIIQVKETLPKTNPRNLSKQKSPKDVLQNKVANKKETVQKNATTIKTTKIEVKHESDIPIEEINRQIAAMEDKELENEFETVSYAKKKEKKNQVANIKPTPVVRKNVKSEYSQPYSKPDPPQYNKNNDTTTLANRENNSVKDIRKPYSQTLKHSSSSSIPSCKPPICPVTELSFPSLSNSQATVVQHEQPVLVQNNADHVVDNYANRTKQQLKKRPSIDNKKTYAKNVNTRKVNQPSVKDSPVYFDNSNSSGIYGKPLRSDISFGSTQPNPVKSSTLPTKTTRTVPTTTQVSKPASPPTPPAPVPVQTIKSQVTNNQAYVKPLVKPVKPISYASKTAGLSYKNKLKPIIPVPTTTEPNGVDSRIPDPNSNTSNVPLDNKQKPHSSSAPAKFVYCREKDPNFLAGKFISGPSINLLFKGCYFNLIILFTYIPYFID